MIPGALERRLRGLAAALILAAPAAAAARGGGGCLEEGTRVATPLGDTPVEALRPGARVWTDVGGRLEQATVLAATRVEPEEYVELAAAGAVVRLTAEHPVRIGPGVFRAAGRLAPGDPVLLADGEGDGLAPVAVERVRRVAATRPAWDLLVQPGGTFLANGLVVHNKGCFLPDTVVSRADGSGVALRDVRPGDALLAFTPEGAVVTTAVREVIAHEVDGYVEVETEHALVRVTREHPFFVGDGTFETVEALRPGDRVFVVADGALRPDRIVSMRAVEARARVYNLQTDRPNTYFANGVAVHNKGGGGCFLPETPLARADGSAVAIAEVAPGEELLAFAPGGALVRARVREVIAHEADGYLTLTTERARVRVTAEHPLYVGEGRFADAGALGAGDRVFTLSGGALVPDRIVGVERTDAPARVYDLSVEWPHTFFAAGLAVHNKGGGGGGRSFSGGRSGSRSSGRSDDPLAPAIVVGIFVVVLALAAADKRRQEHGEDLDFCYGRADIERKSRKTERLLEFLARVDPAMAPVELRMVARTAFLRLQQCWEAREYEPMRGLVMPDLWDAHVAQLESMKRNHEIDKIEDLNVEAVDLVNVRYPHDERQREFTVLVTARARDYYVDDRTGEFLRGDEVRAWFQEFWTFQRRDGAWLLREIEQTRESDALKDENFFEQFTDAGRDRIYGDAAGQAGPAGPSLEGPVETKATRIERLLAFLVQTDRLWDRQAMLERARKVFLDVTLARERGDPAAIPADEVFPDFAAALRAELERMGREGVRHELRNLCVRKVDLVLVRNFDDHRRDEFTVRIAAHAQRGLVRGGVAVHRDADVTPFTEFWTFGRLDRAWRAKEILPPARGEEAVRAENVDEGSSPGQVEWFYRQPRAR